MGLGRSTPSSTGADDAVGLEIGIGIGFGCRPEEARDLRGVLDEVVGLVGQIHLHQHVAGEELALGIDLPAAANLHDLLGRDQDLVEQVGRALRRRLIADESPTFFSKFE